MCGTVVVWWYVPRMREMTHTKQLNLLRYWSSTDPTDSPKLQEKEKEAEERKRARPHLQKLDFSFQ
jgi:hypothetical protein